MQWRRADLSAIFILWQGRASSYDAKSGFGFTYINMVNIIKQSIRFPVFYITFSYAGVFVSYGCLNRPIRG